MATTYVGGTQRHELGIQFDNEVIEWVPNDFPAFATVNDFRDHLAADDPGTEYVIVQRTKTVVYSEWGVK